MKLAQTKLIRAFTRTELLVTIACLALLVAIILPAIAKRTAHSAKIGCRNNVKNIGLAFRVWSADNHDLFPMQASTNDGGTKELILSESVVPHYRALSNEISTPKILLCPNDNRPEATNFTFALTETNISYFLNVDAVENPSDVLAGDRNLTNRPPAGSRLIPITKCTILGWTKEIHFEQGNLLFGDGHVAQFDNGSTGTVVNIPEGGTNRLAVP
jgi:prepilin-type processing-associated H-X9-DG protein